VHPSTILIDVTITAHNSRAADRASLPGCAAEARYAAKPASYDRDYRPPPDDVQLLFFSVETSGFIHRNAKDFLKHILAFSNFAYLQALQSISVALLSARAHSISVACKFLTLDSPHTLPYTAGPLSQVPPPSSTARLLVPRFYALNPTPARPYLTSLSKSPACIPFLYSLLVAILLLNPSLNLKSQSPR
jgi:hypothetical protein